MQELLTDGIEKIQSVVGAYPQVAHAVAEETAYDITADRGWHSIAVAEIAHMSGVQVDDRESVVDVSDIEDAVSAIESAPSLIGCSG